MTFEINRQHKNQEIRIPVETRGPQRMVIKVYHPRKAHTSYFDTAPVITGRDAFTVKIPKIPESVIVELYNEKNGNIEGDNSFRVGKIQIRRIQLQFSIGRILDRDLANFLSFSDEFAENAALVSAQNSVYRSDDGKFRIDYVDVIRDDNGNELKTPAMVNSKTRIIKISKKYYLGYTVPGRKAINLHEYAHVYKNVNPSNEFEADKNAIMIYLGTGNPIIEAYNVFLKVFNNSPHNLNRARYNELNDYLKNFNKIMTKQINN